MHLTLKKEATTPAASFLQQQAHFDIFIEAIGRIGSKPLA
jgi:hypothetical protein